MATATQTKSDGESVHDVVLDGKPWRVRGVVYQIIRDALDLEAALMSPRYKGSLTFHIGKSSVDSALELIKLELTKLPA